MAQHLEEECRSFSSDSIRVLESNLQAMKSLSYLKLTKEQRRVREIRY